MPTHTPSPHRFLSSHAPLQQKPNPKPQSALRNALQTPKVVATSAYPEPEGEVTKLTPAKRFVIPPPRHAKSNSASAIELPTTTQATPRPKVRRKLERIESIEISSQSSLAATQDDRDGSTILPSVEHAKPMFLSDDASEMEQEDNSERDEEMLFDTTPHKRRRLSSLTPQTPVPMHNSTTHRFRLPAVQTPAPLHHIDLGEISSVLQTPASRPQFILPPPPTSPPKPSKPLPEIFSPSRKQGRYLPDGMASTMASWIIETSNTAPDRANSVQYGPNKQDGVKVKVRVKTIMSGSGHEESEVDCYPGGVVFVDGDTEPGLYNASRATSEQGGIKVLLSGNGTTRAKESLRIRSGNVIGVRAPLWDVDIAGQTLMVGMDWVVL